MDDNMGKILERVRKMLRLANDSAATDGERDNAMRMAHATLAKHNLSMADAEARGATAEERRLDKQVETLCWPWMRTVSFGIAKLFFCEYFFARSRKNYVRHFYIGRESNVATASEMSAYVIASIQREANAHKKRGGDPLSFCKGAAARIHERCRALRAEAERASQSSAAPGTAIVLASVYATEQAANKAYMSSELGIGKLKTSVSRQRRAESGDYYAGVKHGDSINLNRQLNGGATSQRRIGQ